MKKGTDGPVEAQSARELSEQHRDCVVELMKQKASIEVCGVMGRKKVGRKNLTRLTFSCVRQAQNKEGMMPLLCAAEAGDIECIKTLVDKKANIMAHSSTVFMLILAPCNSIQLGN